MSTAAYTTFWLLAAVLMQVAAIGPCNNSLIQEIMTENAENCPTDLLNTMHDIGPMMTFRVLRSSTASLFECATGVMDKPEENVALYYIKFTYNDESISPLYVNFTMVEAGCGFVFKYIAEDSYVGFKITFAYDDGISFGYYGCTDEDTPFSSDSDVYVLCYAPSSDSEEVEASLLKCKEHMAKVSGVTDLVLTPACVNDNEYLDYVLNKE